MKQKALEALQRLLRDINPVEISSREADGTLYSWLGSWRASAESQVTILLEAERRNNNERDTL